MSLSAREAGANVGMGEDKCRIICLGFLVAVSYPGILISPLPHVLNSAAGAGGAGREKTPGSASRATRRWLWGREGEGQ